MRLLAQLREPHRTRTPVCLTHVEVSYLGAFVMRREEGPDADLVELAWSRKVETVLSDEGSVWSHTEHPGPGTDQVVLVGATPLPSGPADFRLVYPVVLTQQRGTLRATGPAMVTEPAAHGIS